MSERISWTLLTWPSRADRKFRLFCVQCFFTSSDLRELAKLSPGQEVIMQGKCSGKFANVLLKDCSITVSQFLGN